MPSCNSAPTPARTADDLAGEAALHVARYKLPKAWMFVERIQRSAAGKADYRWAAATAASESQGIGRRSIS